MRVRDGGMDGVCRIKGCLGQMPVADTEEKLDDLEPI